jgi:hypothetical protein
LHLTIRPNPDQRNGAPARLNHPNKRSIGDHRRFARGQKLMRFKKTTPIGGSYPLRLLYTVLIAGDHKKWHPPTISTP